MNTPLTADSGSQTCLHFPMETWRESAPEAQGLDANRPDAAMEYLQSICGAMGVSGALVVRNGVVVWKGGNVRNRHTVWFCRL